MEAPTIFDVSCNRLDKSSAFGRCQSFVGPCGGLPGTILYDKRNGEMLSFGDLRLPAAGKLEEPMCLEFKIHERDTGKGTKLASWNAAGKTSNQDGQAQKPVGKSFLETRVSDRESTSLSGIDRNRRLNEILDRLGTGGSYASIDTLAFLLRSCGNAKALSEGKHVHVHIIENGHEQDRFLGNLLVQMYSKCGALDRAGVVFVKMNERNVFSWTIMIGACAQHGQCREALQLFHHMQLEHVIPDKITFMTVISVCSNLADLAEGKSVHTSMLSSNFAFDVMVGNALINMYGECSSLEDARAVFVKMTEKDLLSWNSMIKAYAQHRQQKAALQLLHQMCNEGLMPDTATYVSILDAFDCQTLLTENKLIHSHIVESGLETGTMVGTALVNMYGKCGSLENAQRMFHKISYQDRVSYNAMIGAYAHQGHSKEAVQFFEDMQLEGIMPNKITFLSLLDACASRGALAQGEKIHAHIRASGLELDVIVGTALVNMYAKSGSLEDAKRMFDKLSKKDAVTWNTMLVAYAQHGLGKDALHLIEQMTQQGANLNGITFFNILSACNHNGMVDEGCHYFTSMRQDHGITPTVEHYNIMIDILVRSGRLNEGEDLICSMPFRPSATSWTTLLGACRRYLDVERGKHAAKKALELDPENDATYVLLSNIYAASSQWEEAMKVREMMAIRGLKKVPGRSWIEVNGTIHEFFVGDELHPQKEEIYLELQSLNKQIREAGYVPDTKVVLHDVKDDEKEHMLCLHSEKLAIAFGVLNTPPETTLRVMKNLQACPDCHSAIKFISKVLHREIIVRDVRRFHHFKNGVCSCADYW